MGRMGWMECNKYGVEIRMDINMDMGIEKYIGWAYVFNS